MSHTQRQPSARAKLECDAAQDQPREHQQERQVNGREQCRVDRRKRAPQDDAGDDQPSLVAVPDGRDCAQHRTAPRFVTGHAEQHADAEIETVEQNVEEYADGEHRHPEHDHA
jgi:hypothetical protein